jgi:hypothetical protein
MAAATHSTRQDSLGPAKMCELCGQQRIAAKVVKPETNVTQYLCKQVRNVVIFSCSAHLHSQCCDEMQTANAAAQRKYDAATAGDDEVKAPSKEAAPTIVEKPKEKPKKVGVFQLFRFATKMDVLLMITGSIAAMGRGLCMPAFTLIFGDIIDTLSALDPTINPVVTQDQKDKLVSVSLQFLYFAAVAFVCSFVQVSCVWFCSR